ncbi:uncharacterized protein N0V89_007626 [Didymosphaeria variabile]|uniref:Uncharacterized protein n=1 Tax=Didymosphaeria variabile TaxID=1932322 RepID=A0A9W8XLH2_9PLEO|nr:uncharacterized protein N0V89_007626 [Didymosphaeria variabile]KAJ4352278.1 hypothetical protein N0V89_007626 [Didymosphaeria variabile]
MSTSTPTHSSLAGFAGHSVPAGESPYVRLYTEALGDLDNPFAKFLKRLHGVSGTIKVGHVLGVGSYSMTAEVEATEALQMLARDAEQPHFKDSWARALTYRYRPLEEATQTNRADGTIREVIQHAEQWVNVLYDAMCNVANVFNKPTSIELSMFKSPTLDNKAVEAACRSVLIALIHRCVVGFCGLRMGSGASGASREDKKLTCKERLFAIVNALKYDKRICKDIMTEDTKIALLVHAPVALSKLKKNQEKGNDAKRDLLAAGTAVRRQAYDSSTALANSQATIPMGLSLAPVPTDTLPAREALKLLSLGSSPAIPSPMPPASASYLPQDLSVLSSSGFAALNKEYASKKRIRVDMDDRDVEEAKRVRMKTDKDDIDATDAVFAKTKKTSSRPKVG